METTEPISVVIPTYRRTDQLLTTLATILECRPMPDEVLVHVDGGDRKTGPAVRARFPKVRVYESPSSIGPGGGRNVLISKASSQVIVSFDDDSWPLSPDFFRRVVWACNRHPDAAVIACNIIEADSVERDREKHQDPERLASDFVGCGSVIRRSAFLKTSGYLPLRYAYGMEETDVSLQLLDLGFEMMTIADLGVFHNCPREIHHSNPRINAAQITNTGLLAFLRYPVLQWHYGLLQILNRVRYAVKRRRLRGIITGLAVLPVTCWRFRSHRRPVRLSTIRQLQSLKNQERD